MFGKRHYDQRRSSTVLRGAMNLTRCLQLRLRPEAPPFVFRDQKPLLRCAPRHKLYTYIHDENEGPSTYMDVIQHNSAKTHSKVSPHTSTPNVIYDDFPTPRSNIHAIRIRLPGHFIKVLANVLVFDICVPGEGHVDCFIRVRSTNAHINMLSVRHTGPIRIFVWVHA